MLNGCRTRCKQEMKVLLQIKLWFKLSVQCPGKKGGTGGRGQILQKRCVRTIFFFMFFNQNP